MLQMSLSPVSARIVLSLVASGLVLAMLAGTAPAARAGKVTGNYPTGVVAAGVPGADISWPNCPKGMGVAGRRTLGLPMPTADAAFFIIGLTNGRAFTRNPCLGAHLDEARARGVKASAYTMLSYPNRAERLKHGRSGPYGTVKWVDQIANVGYAQAAFALDTMAAAGFESPFVWIDVEPRYERAWSGNRNNNRALIRGALRAAQERGIGSGIYTYAYAWRQITGNWQLDLPLWAPGHSNARSFAGREAATRASCARTSFTSGPLVLTQWVWRNRDHNVTCAAISTVTDPLWVDFGAQPLPPTPAAPSPSGSPAAA